MNTLFNNSDRTAYLETKPFENIALLEKCVQEIENNLIERPEITVCGKKCHQRRNVGFFSNESVGYKYSRQMMNSKQLTGPLLELLYSVNASIGTRFNGILVNYYKNGEDYIGAHSDNEAGLDKYGVVSLSYGASRKFRIRDKATKKILFDTNLNQGEMMHMGGNFQKLYTHEIPVEKKVKDGRYSFTFRKHMT